MTLWLGKKSYLSCVISSGIHVYLESEESYRVGISYQLPNKLPHTSTLNYKQLKRHKHHPPQFLYPVLKQHSPTCQLTLPRYTQTNEPTIPISELRTAFWLAQSLTDFFPQLFSRVSHQKGPT